MRSLALLVEYDGTRYVGWQIQPNGVSVQHVLETAVSRTFGVTTPVIGSGRTDTGVHARGQVAHIHLSDQAHAVPVGNVSAAINCHLPDDIRVCDAAEVSPEFHARYDPVWREYVYRVALERTLFHRHYAWIPHARFDRHLFQESASWFEGEHDFTAFSKYNPDRASHICNVSLCTVETSTDMLHVRIRANRFVYGMCRGIVGTMMMAARERITRQEVLQAFDHAQRSLHIRRAPATGLFLNRVEYGTPLFSEHSYL